MRVKGDGRRLHKNMAKTKKKPAKAIEDMTVEETKDLQQKLNATIVDREIAARVAKADQTAKHAGGRPRKYESAEQMQVAIDAYFEDTEKTTICGLALFLGFVSRNSLLSYEGYSEEFFGTIKTAKSRVEAYYEGHLVESGAGGAIFALKNFGWKDKQEHEHEHNVKVEIVSWADKVADDT